MAKMKQSNKKQVDKPIGGPAVNDEEEKGPGSSHKGLKNQRWKAKQMDKAERLWEKNKTLPKHEQLSMRRIAEIVGIGKTTVTERLTGWRKGHGHIAGGRRQPRVLSQGQ